MLSLSNSVSLCLLGRLGELAWPDAFIASTLVRGHDAKTVVWDERACPANQEAPWMPDPTAAVYDWERLAAMVQRTK